MYHSKQTWCFNRFQFDVNSVDEINNETKRIHENMRVIKIPKNVDVLTKRRYPTL